MTTQPYEDIQDFTSEEELVAHVQGIFGEAEAYLNTRNYEHIERLKALFQEMPDWFKEE